MEELIRRIFEAPESELKAAVLRMDADELKNAAQSLGIEFSASGKPIGESKRVDVALAIKATAGDGKNAEEEAEAKAATVETPSISLAKKGAEKPAEKKENGPETPLAVMQKRVEKLRIYLSIAEKELAELIEENAKKQKELTQHDLLVARRALFPNGLKKQKTV